MDSEVPIDDRLLDIVDNDWRKATLPFDLIAVPIDKLYNPNGDDSQPSFSDYDKMWSDLALDSMVPEFMKFHE